MSNAYFCIYNLKNETSNEFKNSEVCFSKALSNYGSFTDIEIYVPILSDFTLVSEQYWINDNILNNINQTFPYYIELLNNIHSIDCTIVNEKIENTYKFPHFVHDKFYKVSFNVENLTKGQFLFIATCIRNGYDTYEECMDEYFIAFFEMIKLKIPVIDCIDVAHYFMNNIMGSGHMVITDSKRPCKKAYFKDIKNRIHDHFNKTKHFDCEEECIYNCKCGLTKFNNLVENKEYEKLVEYLSTLS